MVRDFGDDITEEVGKVVLGLLEGDLLRELYVDRVSSPTLNFWYDPVERKFEFSKLISGSEEGVSCTFDFEDAQGRVGKIIGYSSGSNNSRYKELDEMLAKIASGYNGCVG